MVSPGLGTTCAGTRLNPSALIAFLLSDLRAGRGGSLLVRLLPDARLLGVPLRGGTRNRPTCWTIRGPSLRARPAIASE